MRVFAVSLVLTAVLAAEARVSLQSMNHIFVSGNEYIRLEDWARGTGLNMKWVKTAGTIRLTNSSVRMDLTVDSRRAEIGGVNVWLSLPVINRNGTLLFSVVDAGTTIEPILFPQKSEARLKTICLDPGHGGKDKGEVDGGHYEKKYALLLAREVEKLLKKEGLQVLLTRDSDDFVQLPDRQLMAKRQGADLFVSLHYNSAPEHAVGGLEVYCETPAGMNSSSEGGGRGFHPAEAGNAHDGLNALLAYEILKSLTSAGVPFEDRGLKRSRFEVLREASMPAVLIEGGFMSNPGDARNIYDTDSRKRMAQAIADGIRAYKRAAERPEKEPPVRAASGLDPVGFAAASLAAGHEQGAGQKADAEKSKVH
ncbi:MAG: N-acetylmuramoyl-L-alanine amidase [Verrucomicrobiota bacterium]|jgi:N-acetylmuramoyl-L-alanine amidase